MNVCVYVCMYVAVQGDLTKLNRSNRPVTYRFFLFSDELIYAHLGMKNEYKVRCMYVCIYVYGMYVCMYIVCMYVCMCLYA